MAPAVDSIFGVFAIDRSRHFGQVAVAVAVARMAIGAPAGPIVLIDVLARSKSAHRFGGFALSGHSPTVNRKWPDGQ